MKRIYKDINDIKLIKMDEKYTIEYSLKRLFDKAGKTDKKKFRCEDVKLEIVGKKTSIENFQNLCESFKRQKEHVKNFIDNELRVKSSLWGGDDSKLLLCNMYKYQSVAEVINKYIEKYVVCSACISGNTVIEKIKGNIVLKCNVCNAEITIG